MTIRCPHCGNEIQIGIISPRIRPLIRADNATKRVEAIIPHNEAITVPELKKALPDLPEKSIYNSLGYLTRAGFIRRIGYGHYERSIREISDVR